MKNLENIKIVLDEIEGNPSCWNQGSWHCGSWHCFAGWAQIKAGKQPDDDTVRRDARLFFGFSLAEADYYFDGCRTLDELKTSLDEWEYDRDGYDRDGYDRDGYDRDGYNRAGYYRDGYDRDGFDRNNEINPALIHGGGKEGGNK